MNYLKLIHEIEKRINFAIKNDEYDVEMELKDLLQWIKLNA